MLEWLAANWSTLVQYAVAIAVLTERGEYLIERALVLIKRLVEALEAGSQGKALVKDSPEAHNPLLNAVLDRVDPKPEPRVGKGKLLLAGLKLLVPGLRGR